jgi:hypothetical protein
MIWRGLFLTLVLGGCGLARPSTGNELMDAVLIRVDPFGDCVAVGDQTVILTKSEGPNLAPVLRKLESFERPDVRVAAAAIAISQRDYVWPSGEQAKAEAAETDRCMMVVSTPAYSGSFAFVDYIAPSGVIGVYAFKKQGSGWDVIEHRKLGYW